MAVLPILRWPDSRLTTVCSEITGDARALAADLLETMYDAPGRGLAAPQVGVTQRIFVMDCTWKEGIYAPRVLINPEILWKSEETAAGPEGCLSLPGIVTEITRAKSVHMRWLDLSGKICEEMFTGFAAICAQHEFDHLNGVLTLDHLDPTARATAESALA
ncbi:peptide deformylase [Cypionkella aquatica]|uniref:Peptide deformylase n=1 Tax=Cypionkella aquatica TaxID=1756042 RepID=A0AA37WYG0_9RHOB|nr:peptide deformylase [Cypionkella aquatica]GLS85338.1 peptide deformylase [Cypionkella aquatica]